MISLNDQLNGILGRRRISREILIWLISVLAVGGFYYWQKQILLSPELFNYFLGLFAIDSLLFLFLYRLSVRMGAVMLMIIFALELMMVAYLGLITLTGGL